ncbi:MAG: hypothetical protein AB9866_18480 [Syntrophobacteraceae bacterium]
MTLPAELTKEKNKLHSRSATIWLLEAEVAGVAPAVTLRYVHAASDIVWNGNTWRKSSFSISGLNQSTKGKIAEVQIAVSNVDQAVQTDVERYGGLIGTTVRLYLVSSEHLNLSTPMFSSLFEVIRTECRLDAVIFSIGAENFYLRQFPADTIMSNVCRWWKNGRFKQDRCGYTGLESFCDGTLGVCIQLGNQARYGGAPGLTGYMFEVDEDE